MPRTLILGALTTLFGGALFAQGVALEPVWRLKLPETSLVAGVSFEVTAEVRLPLGYYQDADSDFLKFEPRPPLVVIDRRSSEPLDRDGKPSFTGAFTLTRTVVLPVGSPTPTDISFDLGWQICQVDGVCLLPGQATRTAPATFVPPANDSGWWWMLGAAFVGGLLLNVMPCVFPLLALKGLGLASVAGLDRGRRRREALAFGSGSFLTVLGVGALTAIFSAWGQRLEWGFLFQQPAFVWALVVVFTGLCLSLWGLPLTAWSPFRLTSPGRAGAGPAFLAGAFLVVTAAPCTAPLLGPALGYALTRAPFEILLLFGAVGLGLAAPMALLALLPGWSRWLPKPGPWMKHWEHGAAWLLVATVLYLGWVFGLQTGWIVLGVAGSALGGVIVGLVLVRRRGSVPWWPLGAAWVAAVLVMVVASAPPSASVPGWESFSEARLTQALAEGRPVLVDGTAAWCATCQVNELGVLRDPRTEAELDRLSVLKLRADFTLPSPELSRWLASVDRAGLPVYALYRPGQTPFLFPELLTQENFTLKLSSLVVPR